VRAFLLLDPYGAVVDELATEDEADARREALGADGVHTEVVPVTRVITDADPGDENDYGRARC
jgi:hypothetical protein